MTNPMPAIFGLVLLGSRSVSGFFLWLRPLFGVVASFSNV